jgi:hypothetical protein
MSSLLHFHYKNKLVSAVGGNSCCLLWESKKTHKDVLNVKAGDTCQISLECQKPLSHRHSITSQKTWIFRRYLWSYYCTVKVKCRQKNNCMDHIYETDFRLILFLIWSYHLQANPVPWDVIWPTHHYIKHGIDCRLFNDTVSTEAFI